MTVRALELTSEVVAEDGWRRTLAVTVPAHVVRAELDGALRQVAARLKLPGFRKGRAPLAAVERQYGEPVRRETLQRVIDQAYRAALAERALQPVTEGEIQTVDYRPEAGLTFRISFDVQPRIELARLGGFRVERPPAAVTADDVEAALASVREEHAIWRPVDEAAPPGAGDLVTVRILHAGPAPEGAEAAAPAPEEVGLPWAKRLRLRLGSEHRGRYQFVLGQGDAYPDLEAAVRSLRPGESGEFALRFEAGGAPVERRLRVTLEDRQARDLPALDDVFARSLGEFENLGELREKLRSDLLEEAERRAETVLRARLLDQVLEANPFDVPPPMVERYAASTSGEGAESPGLPPERLRAEAERAVKRLMVLERVAELHDLRASAAELEMRITDIAARGGVAPERVRAQLVKSGRIDKLVTDITNAKVFDFLKARSQILDEPPEGS